MDLVDQWPIPLHFPLLECTCIDRVVLMVVRTRIRPRYLLATSTDFNTSVHHTSSSSPRRLLGPSIQLLTVLLALYLRVTVGLCS
jgi:hypothetical protein